MSSTKILSMRMETCFTDKFKAHLVGMTYEEKKEFIHNELNQQLDIAIEHIIDSLDANEMPVFLTKVKRKEG